MQGYRSAFERTRASSKSSRGLGRSRESIVRSRPQGGEEGTGSAVRRTRRRANARCRIPRRCHLGRSRNPKNAWLLSSNEVRLPPEVVRRRRGKEPREPRGHRARSSQAKGVWRGCFEDCRPDGSSFLRSSVGPNGSAVPSGLVGGRSSGLVPTNCFLGNSSVVASEVCEGVDG